MTSVLLSYAFAQYNLEIPSDVCEIVRDLLRKTHLCCNYCKIDLLNVLIMKPFIRNVSRYYKLHKGNVYTSNGMLSRIEDTEELHADIHVDSPEGTLKVVNTPDIVNICGVFVKNEIITYKQSNWYKLIQSRNDFNYLCSYCFLFHKRKLRKTFAKWKRRT